MTSGREPENTDEGMHSTVMELGIEHCMHKTLVNNFVIYGD